MEMLKKIFNSFILFLIIYTTVDIVCFHSLILRVIWTGALFSLGYCIFVYLIKPLFKRKLQG